VFLDSYFNSFCSKAIKLFSKDNIKNNLIYVNLCNFLSILRGYIKQLEIRKMTLIQSFGHLEEVVKSIGQVQEPLGVTVKEKFAIC